MFRSFGALWDTGLLLRVFVIAYPVLALKISTHNIDPKIYKAGLFPVILSYPRTLNPSL